MKACKAPSLLLTDLRACSIAVSAREALLEQREVLRGAGSRITAVLARLPIINNLSTKINLRKKRDAVILATIIAMCVVFSLWYTLK